MKTTKNFKTSCKISKFSVGTIFLVGLGLLTNVIPAFSAVSPVSSSVIMESSDEALAINKLGFCALRREHLKEAPQLGAAQETGAKAYFYTFKGSTICGDTVCAGAKVRIWAHSSLLNVSRTALTDTNGQYSVSMVVNAQANEPINWEIQASTLQYGQVQSEGQHIAMNEDSKVTIKQVLNVASASIQ